MNRTLMKGAIAIFLTVVCTMGAFAQSPEDFEITQNADNTVTITGYKGTIKDVVIPAKLYNRNVVSIGNRAFSEKGLTSVVIPDTVTIIGGKSYENGAFKNNQLVKVTLGKGLTTIGDYSFRNNPTLTEIIIPDSVTKIGDRAFNGCSLTRIVLGRGLKTIGNYAFAGHKIKVLTIPNGVAFVWDSTFRGDPIEVLSIPISLANGVIKEHWEVNPFRDGPICVTLPANMSDNNLWAFDRNLANFYKSQKKTAGVYIKNGPVWGRGTAAQADQLAKERETAAVAD